MGNGRWLIAIVAAIAVGLLAPQGLSAQRSGQQEMLNRQTLAWSGDWTVQPGLSVESDQLQIIALNRDGALVAYGATATAMPGSEVRDQVLEAYTEGFELDSIERGADGRKLIVLADTIDQGRVLIAYEIRLANGQATGIVLGVLEADLGAAVDLASSTVRVNGEPVFAGLREQVPAAFEPAA